MASTSNIIRLLLQNEGVPIVFLRSEDIAILPINIINLVVNCSTVAGLVTPAKETQGARMSNRNAKTWIIYCWGCLKCFSLMYFFNHVSRVINLTPFKEGYSYFPGFVFFLSRLQKRNLEPIINYLLCLIIQNRHFTNKFLADVYEKSLY